MIGARLGKWVIDKELGRGGMGRVYLGHEEASGQQAAVKVLSAALVQEPGFVQRFQREIEVLAQLDHPQIVRFYASGSQDGVPFYAMEYVEGESFEQLLQQQGRLPWKEVLDAALQIAPALKHAHDRGIIHRDIKPPNLLRTPAGVVKLTDFGVAKVFAARPLTNAGGVIGTAEYVSPEQATGKAATKRSDLYSLGVVLYALLTGRPPFEGRSTAEVLHKHVYAQFDRPSKVVPEIPYEFDEVICRLLEKDPGKRPPDGLVLHRQLESLRRKLDRKAQRTDLGQHGEHTVADNQPEEAGTSNPGLATMVSREIRRELEAQNRGGTLNQWLNKPWVLVVLFLLCVGTIVWAIWLRPEPSRAGKPESEEEQLSIGDQLHLLRELNRVKGPVSAAQRFYLRGLRRYSEGDVEGTRRDWRDVIRSFREVESENRWVRLAEKGLAELDRREERPDESIRQALQKAREFCKQGQREKAEEIWQGLEGLFRDDSSKGELLKEIQRERGR
jgi:serine/threonine-protein kinase